MPNGDLLKQLFRNYKSSDNPEFEAVAQQSIAERNHTLLERVITKARRVELL